MQDTDPMPYGKYKGRPMSDVPASYFHWLWHNGVGKKRGDPVREYIKANMDSLQQEEPDLIWE